MAVSILAVLLMPAQGLAASRPEPIPLEIRPIQEQAPAPRQVDTNMQKSWTGQASETLSGPYITTDPRTGDRILGVSRPEPREQTPEIDAMVVVPEIKLPAKQPRKPTMVYRPGADVQPPGVYRPAQ